MTVSPGPAPRRSATTTTFFVGCLSRSYGCTIRKRTPSRSGVFLVDQTVPMTLPKNIKLLRFSEHFGRITKVTRRRSDNCARSNVNLFALLNGAFHVIFAHELCGLIS